MYPAEVFKMQNEVANRKGIDKKYLKITRISNDEYEYSNTLGDTLAIYDNKTKKLKMFDAKAKDSKSMEDIRRELKRYNTGYLEKLSGIKGGSREEMIRKIAAERYKNEGKTKDASQNYKIVNIKLPYNKEKTWEILWNNQPVGMGHFKSKEDAERMLEDYKKNKRYMFKDAAKPIHGQARFDKYEAPSKGGKGWKDYIYGHNGWTFSGYFKTEQEAIKSIKERVGSNLKLMESAGKEDYEAYKKNNKVKDAIPSNLKKDKYVATKAKADAEMNRMIGSRDQFNIEREGVAGFVYKFRANGKVAGYYNDMSGDLYYDPKVMAFDSKPKVKDSKTAILTKVYDSLTNMESIIKDKK